MSYSVVIPVYNTSSSLFLLESGIKEIFEQLNKDYEIIFVNDASHDPKSWDSIRKICTENQNVIGINLSRNFGQQAATICGMQYSCGKYVITMDDDMQHDPKHIPKLIEQNYHEIVIGSFLNKKHSKFKILTSKLKSYFDRIILGKPKGLQLSAFRLLSRNVVDGILSIETSTPLVSAMMFYISKDAVGVTLSHKDRLDGVSGYNVIKLIRLFSYLLINNSSLLLRFIGNIGLIIWLISILGICITVWNKIFFNTIIAGWTSIIVGLFFFGGIQLFSIGIIGEYLIRIIRNTEKKPSYHIKSLQNYNV